MTTENEKKPIPAWIIRFIGIVITLLLVWFYMRYEHIEKPYQYVVTNVVNSTPEYSYYEGYYTNDKEDTVLFFFNLPLLQADYGGYGIGDTINIKLTGKEYLERIKK